MTLPDGETGTSAIAVRPFRPEDAPALAAIFHTAVHRLAARDYTPEQRRAWSPAPGDPARWASRAADGRTTLVAVDPTGSPVAYADIEDDGHIDHLYRHPDHPAAAAMLYAALEAAALARRLPHLYTEASAPARRFLERRGFVAGARRDFTLGDVPIHNWTMAKSLTRSSSGMLPPPFVLSNVEAPGVDNGVVTRRRSTQMGEQETGL